MEGHRSPAATVTSAPAGTTKRPFYSALMMSSETQTHTQRLTLPPVALLKFLAATEESDPFFPNLNMKFQAVVLVISHLDNSERSDLCHGCQIAETEAGQSPF